MVDKILRLSQIESVEKKKGSSVKWCWRVGEREGGREGGRKGDGEREGGVCKREGGREGGTLSGT